MFTFIPRQSENFPLWNNSVYVIYCERVQPFSSFGINLWSHYLFICCSSFSVWVCNHASVLKDHVHILNSVPDIFACRPSLSHRGYIFSQTSLRRKFGLPRCCTSNVQTSISWVFLLSENGQNGQISICSDACQSKVFFVLFFLKFCKRKRPWRKWFDIFISLSSLSIQFLVRNKSVSHPNLKC